MGDQREIGCLGEMMKSGEGVWGSLSHCPLASLLVLWIYEILLRFDSFCH